mgnify:FL=1
MGDDYVYQAYPKCIYVQDAQGHISAEIVQSPDDLKGLSYAESPAGPFGGSKAKVKQPRKTKRSKA